MSRSGVGVFNTAKTTIMLQGLATWMAQNGATEAEIKEAGRWSSEAWTAYVKKPKLTRVSGAVARREEEIPDALLIFTLEHKTGRL